MDATAALEAVVTAAEAGRDPSGWDRLARLAARALDAETATVAMCGADLSDTVRSCPRTDPDWHRRYDADMHAVNYIWHAALRLPAGRAVTDVHLGGRDAYLRSEIFHAFILPQGMDGVLTLTLTGPKAPRVGLLTVGRRRGKDGFGAEDVRQAEGFARALAVTLAAARAGDAANAAPGAGGFPPVRVLVTPGARVLDRSGDLERLERAGVVTLRRGVLAVPALPGFEASLAMLGQADGGWPPPVPQRFGPFASRLGRAFLILVPGGASAPGAVRLTFAAAPAEDPVAALRREWALTSREMDVALRLGGGETLPEAAAALGIGLSTARTHLGALFEKSGTRTQLALALRVARRLGL